MHWAHASIRSRSSIRKSSTTTSAGFLLMACEVLWIWPSWQPYPRVFTQKPALIVGESRVTLRDWEIGVFPRTPSQCLTPHGFSN
jgi:hypothetical protein